MNNMKPRCQRQRMPNFSIREENVLKILATKYHKEVEEKSSNARVWRMKNMTWAKIAGEFFNITNMERSALKLKSKYETMKKRKQLDIQIENGRLLCEENEKSREQFMQKLQAELERSKKDFELRPVNIGGQNKLYEDAQGDVKTEDENANKEIVVKSLSTLLNPIPQVIMVPKAIMDRATRLNRKTQSVSLESSKIKRRKFNSESEAKPEKEEVCEQRTKSLIEPYLDMIEKMHMEGKFDNVSNFPDDEIPLEVDNHAEDTAEDSVPNVEVNVLINSETEVKTEVSNLSVEVPKTEESVDSNTKPVEMKSETTQISSQEEDPVRSFDAEKSLKLCPCITLDSSSDHFKAQFDYFRNTERRAEQKHEAELKNLEVQRQILELELKVKQREYDIKIQS